MPEHADVAVNVFAKPFQTALSLLSLLRHSGEHIADIWLQFEPVGSRHDRVEPYWIARYLEEVMGRRCHLAQPDYWLDLEAADPARLADPAYRLGIRYQCAFERSASRRLLLIHNDIFVFRDLAGDMLSAMGDAFAIGSLGQCWNCPAAHADSMLAVTGGPPCSPERYADFRPDAETLRRLYAEARTRGVFVRPYDQGFAESGFDAQPWPLPECRVNEWACLIDLEKTRPHCVPFGPALPPGAYKPCGPCNLDIAVAWFRAMNGLGLRARHFPLGRYLKHWVGTGNNTPRRYALSEDNAFRLLQKHFPDYLGWLAEKCGMRLDHP